MPKSMGDTLLNRFSERAQLWAEVRDDDAVMDGKVVMRRRKAYLDARLETFNYVKALERTILEMESVIQTLNGNIEGLSAELADKYADIRRLSQELEGRNRLNERGPDDIGREYIMRLGIPELTEVFNRTVLGR